MGNRGHAYRAVADMLATLARLNLPQLLRCAAAPENCRQISGHTAAHFRASLRSCSQSASRIATRNDPASLRRVPNEIRACDQTIGHRARDARTLGAWAL